MCTNPQRLCQFLRTCRLQWWGVRFMWPLISCNPSCPLLAAASDAIMLLQIHPHRPHYVVSILTSQWNQPMFGWTIALQNISCKGIDHVSKFVELGTLNSLIWGKQNRQETFLHKHFIIIAKNVTSYVCNSILIHSAFDKNFRQLNWNTMKMKLMYF